MVVLGLAWTSGWSGWSFGINSLFALRGCFSGEGAPDWTRLGTGAKRQGFRKNEGGNGHTVMVGASRHFIHGDIKLQNFKITARKATLQVPPKEQHRFLIIPVG